MKISKGIIAFFVIMALHCATSMNPPPGPPHSSVHPFYPPPPGPPPHHDGPPPPPPPPPPPLHDGPPPHDGTNTNGLPPPPQNESVPPILSLDGVPDPAQIAGMKTPPKKKKKQSAQGGVTNCTSDTDTSDTGTSDTDTSDALPPAIYFVDGTKLNLESITSTTIATLIKVLKTVVSQPSIIPRAIVCEKVLNFLLVKQIPVIIDLEDGNFLVVFPDNTFTCVSASVLKSLGVDIPLLVPIFKNLPEFHMGNGESHSDYNLFFKGTIWSLAMDQPPEPVIPKDYPSCPSIDTNALIVLAKEIDTVLNRIEPQDQFKCEAPVRPRKELQQQLPLQPLVLKMQTMGDTTMVFALDVSGSMYSVNGRIIGTNLTRFLPEIKEWIKNILATGIFNPVFPTVDGISSGNVPMMNAIAYVVEKVVDVMNMTSPYQKLVIFPFSHTIPSQDVVFIANPEDAQAFLSTLTYWIEKISANLGSTRIRVPLIIKQRRFESCSHVCIISDGAIDMVNGKPEQASVDDFNTLVHNHGDFLQVSCAIVCANNTEMSTNSQEFGVLRQLFDSPPGGNEDMNLITLKYGNLSLRSSEIVAVETDEIDFKTKKPTLFKTIESIALNGQSIQLKSGLESMVIAGNLTGSNLGLVLPALCNHIVQATKNEAIVSKIVSTLLPNLAEKYVRWVERNLNRVPVSFFTLSTEEQEKIVTSLISLQKQSQVVPENVEDVKKAQVDTKKAKSEGKVATQPFLCFNDLLRKRNKLQSPLKIDPVDALTFDSREGMMKATVVQSNFDTQMTLVLQKLHCIKDGDSMAIAVCVPTRDTKWRLGFASIELDTGATYPEPKFEEIVKCMGINLKVTGDNMLDVLKRDQKCILAVSNHVTADRSMGKAALVVPKHLPNNDIIVRFSRSSPDQVTVKIERNGSITGTHTLVVTPNTFLSISAVMPASIVTITGKTLQKINPEEPLITCELPVHVTQKPQAVQRKYVMPPLQKDAKCPVLTPIAMKVPVPIDLYRIVVNEDGFSIISINPRSPVSGMRSLTVVELIRYGSSDPTVCNNLMSEILRRCLMFSDLQMIEFLSTSTTLTNSMGRFISLRCEIPIEDAVAFVDTICNKKLRKVFDIASIHMQVLTLFPSSPCLDLRPFKPVVSDGRTLAEVSWLDDNLRQIGKMSIWKHLSKKISFAPENTQRDLITIILATISVPGIEKFSKCIMLMVKITMRMAAFGDGTRFSFGTTSSPNEFRLWLIKLDRFMKSNCLNGDGVLKHILTLHGDMKEALKKHIEEEEAIIKRITHVMHTTDMTIVSEEKLDPNVVHAVGLNWGKVSEDGFLCPYEASDISGTMPELTSTPSGNMLVSPAGLFGTTRTLTTSDIMSQKELKNIMTKMPDQELRPLVSWVDIGLDGKKFDVQPRDRTYFYICPVFNHTTYTRVTDTIVEIIALMHPDDKTKARWTSLIFMKVLSQLGVFDESCPPLNLVSIAWRVMLKLPAVAEKKFDYSSLAESVKFACSICLIDQDITNSGECVTFPITPCCIFCSGCIKQWAQQTRDMSFDKCVATGVMIQNPMTGLQESATAVSQHCRARNTPGTPEYATFQEYLELLRVSRKLISGE